MPIEDPRLRDTLLSVLDRIRLALDEAEAVLKDAESEGGGDDHE